MSAKNVALCRALGWHTENMAGYVGLFFNNEYRPRQGNIGYYFSHEQAWSAVPDIEHDIAAGLAALDATGRAWQLVRVFAYGNLPAHYEVTVYTKGSESDIDFFKRGITPAEAVFNALCSYYHVEVSSE